MLLGVGSAESVRRGPRYLPLRIRHGMRGEVLTLPKRGSGFVHGSRDTPCRVSRPSKRRKASRRQGSARASVPRHPCEGEVQSEP